MGNCQVNSAKNGTNSQSQKDSVISYQWVHIQPLSGLAPRGHISHRLHLWLFTFNPFRVGAYQTPFPQVAPVAIHIQPLQGWRYSLLWLITVCSIIRLSA